jgi:hypothetical protein
MGKIKARKVCTLGSHLTPGRGRLRKADEPKEKGNRLQYSQAEVLQVTPAVNIKLITVLCQDEFQKGKLQLRQPRVLS